MIQRLLQQSTRVLISTHESPDGDALGSLIAMGTALTRMGKDVVMYNGSRIPAVYRFLPETEQIVRSPGDIRNFDTAVILDCSQLMRIGAWHEQVNRIPVILNIDHHTTNNRFGTAQLIRPDACATCEIIHDLLCSMGIEIDKTIATAIYTGILTDTGSFRFSNTNQAAFSIATKMVETGADPYLVAQHVYGTYSLGRIKLLNMVLDSIELSENGKISIMRLTQEMLKETGTSMEDVDGLVNYAKHIEDVRVAALIQEMDRPLDRTDETSRYSVSLRSDGTIDVSGVAMAFGGGGHINAAGFTVRSSYADLKRKLFDLARELEKTSASQ